MRAAVVKVEEAVEASSSLKLVRMNMRDEMSALEHALAPNSTPQCVP
jgi:hypothetical protein